MNVLAHGIDLVHCPRVERIWNDHGQRFLDRVFTTAEQKYCLHGRDALQRLCGRFAVKEAVMKVLGTGWRGKIEWTGIETLPDPAGRPLCTLHGATLEMSRTLGIEQMLVSISHSGDYAMASALGLGPTAQE